MKEETYSMVQELTNSYVVGKPDNGVFKIEIVYIN